MRAVLITILCGALAGCSVWNGEAPERSTATYNHFPGRHVPFSQASGRVVAAYLPNYSIASGYDLNQLPPGNLTHLLYAFLTICGPGQRASDTQVCANKRDFALATDDSTQDETHHTLLANAKRNAPALKVLASVGGARGSNPFFHMAGESAKRAVFVASITEYLNAHPAFDGIDINWEAPTDNLGVDGIRLGSPSDGHAYIELLGDLRVALDQLGASHQRRYLLTSAVMTDANLVARIDYFKAQEFVDYFFAMTYDYFDGRAASVGHHSALYAPSNAVGIQNLLAAGVRHEKLVLGVAMYGRGWANCTDPDNPMLGTGDGRFNGAGGAEMYRRLAANYLDAKGNGVQGYEVRYDPSLHSYYLWNPVTRTFIGYDDPRAVVEKARYATNQNFAGIFAWQLALDNGDVLSAMNHGVGNLMDR